MKAWIFGVFAVAGCNQIFGNHQAIAFDAPKFDSGLGIDTAPTTMSLQYMVLGDPESAATFVKLDGKVQVGAVPPAVLGDADVQTQDADGNFAVPLALSVGGASGAPFRVRYTPADGIPVDFTTKQITAHFVVPSVGRLTPRAPVIGTGTAEQTVVEAFAGGPDGSSSSWTRGRFFEVGGLWAVSEQNACCIGLDKSVLANWVSLSGPQALPTEANDVMVLTDAKSDGGSGFLVYGYGTVTATGFDANGNPTGAQTSAWMTPTAKTLLKASPATHDYSTRAFGVENDAGATNDPIPVISGGVVASLAITPFTGPILKSGATAGGLEQVVFLSLAESNTIPMSFVNPFVANNAPLPALRTVVVQKGSVTRTFADTSIKVSSGITALAQVDSGNSNATFGDGNGDGVALATNIKLNATLLLNMDHAPVIAGGAPLTLSFQGDMGATLVDDCMITLYRLDTANNAITPTHRYLVNAIPTEATPLLIENTVFDLSSEYTFGITCFNGHPQAKMTSDWSVVSYPMAASTVYTKSFKVTN